METVKIDIDLDEFIQDNINEAALYEQLAEEASELAQAALKMARIIRGENPTPTKLTEARTNLIEEYTDVCIVSDILVLPVSTTHTIMKKQRWVNRIITQLMLAK